MPRRVRLVLLSGDGNLLGTLPEFAVESPWWPDVEPVVRTARAKFGVDISVLRLLTAENESGSMGGPVTYSAELLAPLPSTSVLVEDADSAEHAALVEHPRRMPWARIGGIAATVSWADTILSGMGRPRTAPVVQVKSWNLSCVLRLPTEAGDVWCKSVPPFFGHEGTIMRLVATHDPALVPPVIAVDRPLATVLLGDVEGEDQWEAPPGRLIEMVQRWVRVQAAWADQVDELLDAGLPDWRGNAFNAAVASFVGRPDVRRTLSRPELARLDRLVRNLPERLRALSACGLPDTLVHGDFHPGNWVSDGTSLVLLDWGDSGVGSPMLDAAAFLARPAPDVRDRLRAAWIDAWRQERSQADPARAAALIAPVAALRQALIYQQFLDGIEPSEHRYHAQDVPRWLRQAMIDGDSKPA